MTNLISNLNQIIPTLQLDMLGEPCPYPAVATLEILPSLKDKDILEVISDCPQSINNIPIDVVNHGYKVLKIEQFGPVIRFYLSK